MIPGLEDVMHGKTDKEKSALDNLFPSPMDLPDQIKLIGTYRGSPPTIGALYEARIVFDLLKMMAGKKTTEMVAGKEIQENWDELSMSKYYEERSSALGGKHADRAVEIARAAPRQEIPLTWFERIMGKGK